MPAGADTFWLNSVTELEGVIDRCRWRRVTEVVLGLKRRSIGPSSAEATADPTSPTAHIYAKQEVMNLFAGRARNAKKKASEG